MLEAKYDFWAGHIDLANVVEIDVDRHLRTLISRHSDGNEEFRRDWRSQLNVGDSNELITFAKRSAVLTMKQHQHQFLIDGLTAISALDTTKTDFRDMLVALAFLHHAGVREGADVGQDFQRAASLSDQKTSKLIMDFLGRPASGKDLRSAWGHDEVTTESGTGLIGWGLLGVGTFHPTYDFKRLALDVADVIAHDRYQPNMVTVAQRVSPIWFRKPLGSLALLMVRASAGIFGVLRPGLFPNQERQNISVCLVESISALNSVALVQLVKRPIERIALKVCHGRLFGIVLASGPIYDDGLYETPDSINRLAEPLKRALQNARKLAR